MRLGYGPNGLWFGVIKVLPIKTLMAFVFLCVCGDVVVAQFDGVSAMECCVITIFMEDNFLYITLNSFHIYRVNPIISIRYKLINIESNF